MRRISKRLKSINQTIDKTKIYPLNEAIELAIKTSNVKFDASLDLAFNLNLDVKQVEQQLRGSISLPYGTGKKINILVVTDTSEVKTNALDAGADEVLSSVDLAEILSKKPTLKWDVIVVEPKMMPFLSRFGKQLGPKGLMPNPKLGTVTNNVTNTIQEIKKGKVNYRTDKTGIIHTPIGKVSMDKNHLLSNAQTIIDTIKKIKPSTVKGVYIKNLTISSTMGPSFKIIIST
ncbi:MAG: 50S ribosomal protein L1 [Mycoplasma sp.]|nr:50S ribosomal protein L1 [Mycoplasma sp.]